MPSRKPPKAHLRRNARDYIRARSGSPFDDDLDEDIRSAGEADSPVRVALEFSSDYGFASEAVRRVVDLDPDLASHAPMLVRETLLDPAVALLRSTGEGQHILQALIVARDEARNLPYDVAVSIEVIVTPRTQLPGQRVSPPIATLVGVTADFVDMDDTAEVLIRIRQLMTWSLHLPSPAFPSDAAPMQVVVAGDMHACAGEAPREWRDDLNALVAVFGATMRSELLTRTKDLDFGKRTTHIIALEPRLFTAIDEADTGNAEILKHDLHSLTYIEVLDVIATDLLGASPRRDDVPKERHHLIKGEKRFHRKKLNSGGGHDNFDEVNPCTHEKGFTAYKSAPQAEKGMHRLYDNFSRDMLYHCSKNGCNVYAVFA